MESQMSTVVPACGTWRDDREEENRRDKEWWNILEASQIDLQWLMHPRNMCSVLETACKAEKLLSIWNNLLAWQCQLRQTLGKVITLFVSLNGEIFFSLKQKNGKKMTRTQQDLKRSQGQMKRQLWESRRESLSDVDRQKLLCDR